jgi:hypothetical protein
MRGKRDGVAGSYLGDTRGWEAEGDVVYPIRP